MATLVSTGPNPLNPDQQATCTLVIDDALMIGAVQAVCVMEGYQQQVDNKDYDEAVEGSQRYLPNPQGPGEFTMNWIFEMLKRKRHEFLELQARQAAAEAIQNEASAVTITSEVIE